MFCFGYCGGQRWLMFVCKLCASLLVAWFDVYAIACRLLVHPDLLLWVTLIVFVVKLLICLC